MADNILMTPAITVAVGLAVFGATQLVQRLWLDPVTEPMKALGRAAYVHAYFANVYASPGNVSPELDSKTSKKLRQCAAELRAELWAVRLYWPFQAVKQLPQKKCKASRPALYRNLERIDGGGHQRGMEGSRRDRQTAGIHGGLTPQSGVQNR